MAVHQEAEKQQAVDNSRKPVQQYREGAASKMPPNVLWNKEEEGKAEKEENSINNPILKMFSFLFQKEELKEIDDDLKGEKMPLPEIIKIITDASKFYKADGGNDKEAKEGAESDELAAKNSLASEAASNNSIDTVEGAISENLGAINPPSSSAPMGSVGLFLRETAKPALDNSFANISLLATNEKKKESAAEKRSHAEMAVDVPISETEALEQAGQAASIDEVETPATNEDQIKRDTNIAIENSIPSDIEGVLKFKRRKKTRGISRVLKKAVKNDVKNVVGTYNAIETPITPPPSPKGTPLPQIETPIETADLSLSNNIVPDLLPEHTDFSSYVSENNKTLEKEGITDEHLNMVTSGDLFLAKQERDKLNTLDQTASTKIQETRDGELTTMEENIAATEAKTREEMRTARTQELENSQKAQETAKTGMEAKRLEISTHINSLYETAKNTVSKKLADLETSSVKQFENKEKSASSEFEDEVDSKIKSFKRERYSGWRGKLRWLKDKWYGIDKLPAVKSILDTARSTFIAKIDTAIAEITAQNQAVIAECQQTITDARTQIDEYVNSLPGELRTIGEQAQGDISTKLDALDSQIKEKEEALKAKLEEQKEAAIAAIDERIEEMKAEMGGLLDKLGSFLLNAAIKFFKWALTSAGLDPSKIMGIINQGVEMIKTIVNDPGQFLDNLGSAVSTGFNNFKDNIQQHIFGGITAWLTGQLGSLQITLPEKWDLKGVLNLSMQVLGLTYESFKKRLVKLAGVPRDALSAAEEGFEVVKNVVTDGPIALWETLKDKIGDIKTTIIEGIKSWAITEMVKKAVIKILSMLNPAGAIVQIVMTIYNVVMFFVENGQRLVELFKTFISSIGDMVSGNIGGAASKIEQTLIGTIPVMVSLLARLAGLGGVAKAVKKIIKRVTKPINKALNKVAKSIGTRVKKWFGGKKGKKGKTEEEGPSKQKGKGKIDNKIGKRLPFNAGKEKHHLWIEVKGGKVVPMVASEETTIHLKLEQWKKDKQKDGFKAKVKRIGSLISIAETNFAILKRAGNEEFATQKKTKKQKKVSNLDKKEKETITAEEKMARSMKLLFEIFDKGKTNEIIKDLNKKGIKEGVSIECKDKSKNIYLVHSFTDDSNFVNLATETGKNERRRLKQFRDAVMQGKIVVHKPNKKVPKMELTVITFNCYKKKFILKEYEKQVRGQENGLNAMLVEEWYKNRVAYTKRKSIGKNGRHKKSTEAQREFRIQEKQRMINKELKTRNADIRVLKFKLQNEGKSQKEIQESLKKRFQELRTEAEIKVDKYMDTVHALHDSDQITGGSHDAIHRLGNKGINSSMGAQWIHKNPGSSKKRFEVLDEAVKKFKANKKYQKYVRSVTPKKSKAKMNVQLNVNLK